MSNIIDSLINLDIDHYINSYKDVQTMVKGMTEIDRKLWVLSHLVKYGYGEGRKYRLKEVGSSSSTNKKTPTTTNTATSTEPCSLIDDEAIISLINNSRQKKLPDHQATHIGYARPASVFWEVSCQNGV